jgi:hypothetical protein
MLYRLLFILFLVNSKIIKNIDLPSCRNCKHYKVTYYNDYTSTLNKCSYFGTKDINTNEINFEYVDHCRTDENLCGLNGKYFEEDKNIELKILLFNLKKFSPFFLAIIISSLPIFLKYK